MRNIYSAALFFVGVFGESDQQPLFRAIFAKVDQRGCFIFGQIVNTGFDHIVVVITDGECRTLRVLVDRALDHLRFIRCRVGVVTSNGSLLVDSQLHGDIRFGGVVFGQGEDAEGQPIGIDVGDLRLAPRGGERCCR